MDSSFLFPDWILPKSIGLVWPGKLPDNRESLMPFYESFIGSLINKIPDNIKITLIHRPGEKEKIVKRFTKERLNLVQNSHIQDIWIRDFAPFWKSINNKIIPVKGKYYPSYGGEAYLKSSSHDDSAGEYIGGPKLELMALNNKQIIFDGGNLTHNGNRLGISTNRLISANEFFFTDQLIYTINTYLCLKKIILVPSEFGDDTGHIDGLVRFINKNTVLVSEYPYKWKVGKNYIPENEYHFEQNQLNEIAKYLHKQGLNVFRIPNGIPLNNNELNFESAVGNYTNFLRIGNTFFIPQYDYEEHNSNAIKAFRDAKIKQKDIIPIPKCSEVAILGGVLNCITTHIYS